MLPRSPALFQLHLWGGLLIFCGFVVYDTQAIIEKRRRGDKDAIRHSLDLFIDFIQLFRKILILLMQKVSELGSQPDVLLKQFKLI